MTFLDIFDDNIFWIWKEFTENIPDNWNNISNLQVKRIQENLALKISWNNFDFCILPIPVNWDVLGD